MASLLLPIYGPLAIQSYGVAVATGLSAFLWLIQRDRRLSTLVKATTFNNIITVGIISGIIGGRLLHVLSNGEGLTLWEICSPWIGGFSILGTILGIAIIIPLYLWHVRISILPLLDLAALYAPLMQAIARLGCFFAGCCYGITTDKPWAITYHDEYSLAPCSIPLHPTQLYSSFTLFVFFLILYFFLQYRSSKPGYLTCFYLIGIGIERFIIDFWRADRVFSSIPFLDFLSIHQWISGGILIVTSIVFAYLAHKNSSSKPGPNEPLYVR